MGQVYFEVSRCVEGEVAVVQGLVGGQELPGEPGGEGDILLDIAGLCCGFLNKNTTAHYKNLFCVSFYCCFDQEPSTHL